MCITENKTKITKSARGRSKFQNYTRLGLHLVADLEAQVVLRLAVLDFFGQKLLVLRGQAADEDQAALALFVVLPLQVLREPGGHQHVHALEDELFAHVLHGQHALVPEEVVGLLRDQLVQPALQAVGVQVTLEPEVCCICISGFRILEIE